MSKGPIERFNFHGSELDVIRDDGKLWVSVRRVCEHLVVDESSQRQKLGNKTWACTVLITARDSAGREQPALFIDLDSLPMWLATIEPSRVAAAARPRLEDFQKECARVLRDHFFGKASGSGENGGTPSQAMIAAVVAVAVEAIRPMIEPIVTQLRTMGERTAAAFVEADQPVIGQGAASEIRGRLRRIASIRARVLGDESKTQLCKQRNMLENDLRQRIAFPRSAGMGWQSLPKSKHGDAIVALQSMEESAKSLIRDYANVRQLKLASSV